MKKQDNAIIGIYKITSPTNKVYIGQSGDIKKRWKIYFKNSPNQPKIFRSFKKHGVENHKFEIIEECSLDQLNEKEIYWKQYYINLVGWEKVLFCQLIDGNGGNRSEETKQKISKANKGRKFNDEICRKISLAKKGCNVWSKGKKLSKTHCKNISEQSRGKSKPSSSYLNNQNSAKCVLQYDMNGEFIKEWPSAKQAALFYNKTPESIQNCCKGICKTSNKYIWKYKQKLKKYE